MSRKSSARLMVMGAPLLAALLLAGCRPETLASVWHTSSSAGQGGPDWRNSPAYRVKNFPGRIIIANDSSDIYLGLYSPDRHLAGRLKGSGLTVWLTNPLNKSERLGIRYPLGRRKEEMKFPSNRFLPDARLSPSDVGALLEMPSNDLEILVEDATGSGKKSRDEAEQLGVRAHFSEAENAVEYMLTIRMGQLAPWLRPGSNVLLEIESPAMERPKFEHRGSPEEGGRGRGGMPPGGRRGGRRHGSPEDKDQSDDTIPLDRPIHLSFTIDLAVKPAS